METNLKRETLLTGASGSPTRTLGPADNIIMNAYRQLVARNKPLALLGLANGVLFMTLLIGSFGNELALVGINSLYKPMKFALSIWVVAWTMPWLLQYLDKPRAVNRYSWVAVVTLGFEQWAITSQALRGELSHFNRSSAYDLVVFILMGVFIMLFTLWTAYIAILFFRQRRFRIPRASVWGIRAGLVCFVVFSLLGGYISYLSRHTVGAVDGGPGLPFINWSRAAGDLRVAHFLGLHGLQVLPLLGYTVTRFMNPKTAPKWVLIGSLLYIGFVFLTLIGALMGKPLFS